MVRFQRLRNYASKLYQSVRRLLAVIKEIAQNIGRFLHNIWQVLIIAIRRGLDLLRIEVISLIKAVARGFIDAVKWPLERIIAPAMRWLADKSDAFLTLIRTHDEIALGCFLALILGTCLTLFLLIRVFR